jgi:hypothetical protein
MSDDKEKQAPEPRPSRSDYEKSLEGLGNLRPKPKKPDSGDSERGVNKPKPTGSDEN